MGQPPHLDEGLRVALYRATCEAVVNVIKHARARKVNLKIENFSNFIKISVVDNGIGFKGAGVDQQRTLSDGLGLFMIRERLEYFGGTLNIKSKPGKGSKVTFTVPLIS